jgi:hypothetical protein
MTVRHAAAMTGSALLLFGLLTVAILFGLRAMPSHNTVLMGAVLTADPDPRKQMPVPDVEIYAASGASSAHGRTDSSGFYQLNLQPGVKAGSPVTLSLTHQDYKPLEVTTTSGDTLDVERMTPILDQAFVAKPAQVETVISDLRIRYTVKVGSTADVGTVVKTFEATNEGNVPCKGKSPCSPDGRWRAAIASLSLDAPESAQFRDVRVSCIAGPCPFTRIEPNTRSEDSRTLRLSALNWSDTATFLVEADVVHTIVSDMVRQSYPVVFGRGMSFTLPGTSAGPSIEAEVNGSYTVFPLGPDLLLSWANCTLSENSDHSRLYSCELKPGFRFQ